MTKEEGTVQEIDRLKSLHRLNLLNTEPEARFEKITQLAKSIFGCRAAAVSLVDETRTWFKSHPGLDYSETPLDQSICVHTIQQDDVFVIENTALSPLFASEPPPVTGLSDVGFYAGTPLYSIDGYKIGTLSLFDPSPRTFSDEDKLRLKWLADLVEGQINLTDQLALNHRASEQQAYSKAILMAMPDMIFVVNRKGIFLGSNDHPKQSMKNDDLLGKTLHDALPAELVKQSSASIAEALSSGQQVTFEYQMDIEGTTYFEARVSPLHEDQVIFVIRDITNEVIAEAELTKNRTLVNAIANAQSQFIHEEASEKIFTSLLSDLLILTDSAFGLVGEVRYESEQPYIVAKAISEGGSNNPFFQEHIKNSAVELEFRASDTLLSATLNASLYVISNSPETDERGGGLPEGHPNLESFIGIPIRYGDTLVAMLGLANRPGGYGHSDYDALTPLINTIAQMFDAINRKSKTDWANRQIRVLSEVSRQTSNGIIITDLNGRIEWVNDAFINITGYELTEVIGKKPGGFLQGPDTDHTVVEHMSTCISLRQGFNVELVNYDKAGNPYWIDVNCSTLKDDTGTTTGFLAIQNDINAQKQSELITRDSLRLQQAILDTMVDGLITTDKYGTIQLCNPACEKLFGYSTEELIGKNVSVLMPESYSKHHDKHMENYRVSEKKYSIMGRTRDLTGKRKNGSVFPLEISVSETEHKGFTLYVALIRDITEAKNQQMAIERLAYLDPLTQLANRRLMDDRIVQLMAQSTRSNSYFALLIIDLDDFKNINDSLGHRIGDKLLIELSHRISSSIWHGDTAARLGGDEFCLLLTSLGENELQAMERARLVAARVLNQISKPFITDGKKLITSASIGVTTFRGESIDPDGLLKQADIAMYEAKKDGKNRISLFNHAMEERVLVRLERQADLRQAISEGSLCVYYQPKVDQTSKVVGLEALVRWQHPVDGWISPEEFIPIAEDHQLILPLGDFVLQQAMKDMESWLAINPDLNWTLAVNISQYQLSSEQFLNQIESVLNGSCVDPKTLVLEVTESALAEQIECSIQRMNALKALGITFSLDDFGTGYSSLAYLKQLPINELKIDRSFLQDLPDGIDDVKIVNSILSLAKALGLSVVAEGVENAEQWHFLINGKCDQFQGYYFSRPLPASEIDLLARLNQPLVSK